MREYLFHGKRVDNGEWVEGYLNYNKPRNQYYIMDDVNAFPIPVYDESVGQCTGFDEWMLDDTSRDAKLYEGDIVEVWLNRQIYGQTWSQYDGPVKFRGVIVFKFGEWRVDFKNKHNEVICKARGKEENDRNIPCGQSLYNLCFHCYDKDREEYRKQRLELRERCKKWGTDGNFIYDDIVKIGNVFENADLLEE